MKPKPVRKFSIGQRAWGRFSADGTPRWLAYKVEEIGPSILCLSARQRRADAVA